MAPSCGAADDVARSSDDVARLLRGGSDDAIRSGGDVLEAATASHSIARVQGRTGEAVHQLATTQEVEQALIGVTFKVICEAVDNGVPNDLDAWVVRTATQFGVQFFGEGEQLLAEAILAALDSDADRAEADQACDQLGDV